MSDLLLSPLIRVFYCLVSVHYPDTSLDVPVLGDVLTGGHPLNQISVELAPGGIVDVTDERI